ncbi:hypothetical protein FOI68_11505 [Brevibacillus sp. LEMMJ03]|uniref:hypothetical protein n=1 Tax=Brevibacillus sp. LEMMJ03 TaxID=2595056 RepID=UPI00118007B2|nr:hypothetical protein [Brevibacillus sp. LEMMJ03]TRY25879.1 hypothetical protein FOI68_11505 [Brevibacillus sp. LEMMJ03]
MKGFDSIAASMFPGEWNIIKERDGDSEASTILLEHSDFIFSRFPEQSFLLDRFPKRIADHTKFASLALSFGEVEDNPVLRSRYINEEQKFIRVFQLLWAYDNVWVETSLRYENTERIKEVLQNQEKEKRMFTALEKLIQNDSDHLQIEELADLEVFLELGLRETVSSVFVFENMHVCTWSNFDLNMPMFIGNSESLEILRTIITTEGLYLRR